MPTAVAEMPSWRPAPSDESADERVLAPVRGSAALEAMSPARWWEADQEGAAEDGSLLQYSDTDKEEGLTPAAPPEEPLAMCLEEGATDAPVVDIPGSGEEGLEGEAAMACL